MNLEKVLKYTVLGGVFLLPLIPFVVSSTMFFPFITGKNFAFRIIVEVIFALWVVLAVLNPAYRPKRSWILWAILAFTAVMGAANLFGVLPGKSFWSNFERMEGYITILHLVALFVVAGSTLTTENLWKRFFHVSIFASVLMGLYGVFQFLGFTTINQGGVRLDGTFGNATYLAIYMLFHAFIALFYMLRHKGATFVRLLYGGAIVLYIFVLYNTATRGSILGLIGGVLIVTTLIALFERGRPLLRKLAIGGVISVIVIVFGFFVIKDTKFVYENPVLSRFASISLEERTTRSRFIIWNMSYQGFKERPVLGWGQENYNFVFNKYYDTRMYDQEGWFDRAHNVVFDWLIAGGILGLLSYILIFVSVLYCLWFRRGRFSITDKSILTGLLAAYFFHNFFVFDNIVSYIYFFTVLAFVYGMTTSSPEESIAQRIFNKKAVERVVVPVVIILMALTIYSVNVKGILTARTLISAINPGESVENSMTFFEKALAYDSIGKQEVREQLAQYAARVATSNLPQNTKMDVMEFAEREMRAQIEEVPDNARHHFFLATLLRSFGRRDEALMELDKTLKLSPDKQFTLYEVGYVNLNNGDIEAGVAAFKKAFDLSPESNSARRLYGGALIFIGDDVLAEEILLPVFGTTLIAEPIFINAYSRRGEYDKVAVLWERIVFGFESEKYDFIAEPNNVQARLSLAATYLQIGRREEAIEQLEVVAGLESALAETVDFYISEIRAGRNP